MNRNNHNSALLPGISISLRCTCLMNQLMLTCLEFGAAEPLMAAGCLPSEGHVTWIQVCVQVSFFPSIAVDLSEITSKQKIIYFRAIFKTCLWKEGLWFSAALAPHGKTPADRIMAWLCGTHWVVIWTGVWYLNKLMKLMMFQGWRDEAVKWNKWRVTLSLLIVAGLFT